MTRKQERIPEGRAEGRVVRPYLNRKQLGPVIGLVDEKKDVISVHNNAYIGYIENGFFYKGKRRESS